METITFRGFSFSLGSPMYANLEILDKDRWDPQHLRIAIVLRPEEEPTEERLLQIIKNGLEDLKAYKGKFIDFEAKYRGRELILYPEESLAKED